MSWKFLKNKKKESSSASAKKEIKPETSKEEKKSRHKVFVGATFLKHPHLTEKASQLATLNKYVFAVSDRANKNIIKKEIENRFGVEIEAINLVTLPPKQRKKGLILGWKPGLRKAIVTVKEGHSIDLN